MDADKRALGYVQVILLAPVCVSVFREAAELDSGMQLRLVVLVWREALSGLSCQRWVTYIPTRSQSSAFCQRVRWARLSGSEHLIFFFKILGSFLL